jgi:hypothetical protein
MTPSEFAYLQSLMSMGLTMDEALSIMKPYVQSSANEEFFNSDFDFQGNEPQLDIANNAAMFDNGLSNMDDGMSPAGLYGDGSPIPENPGFDAILAQMQQGVGNLSRDVEPSSVEISRPLGTPYDFRGQHGLRDKFYPNPLPPTSGTVPTAGQVHYEDGSTGWAYGNHGLTDTAHDPFAPVTYSGAGAMGMPMGLGGTGIQKAKKGYSMGPDELAMLEMLLAQGIPMDQAMGMLGDQSGAWAADSGDVFGDIFGGVDPILDIHRNMRASSPGSLYNTKPDNRMTDLQMGPDRADGSSSRVSPLMWQPIPTNASSFPSDAAYQDYVMAMMAGSGGLATDAINQMAGDPSNLYGTRGQQTFSGSSPVIRRGGEWPTGWKTPGDIRNSSVLFGMSGQGPSGQGPSGSSSFGEGEDTGMGQGGTGIEEKDKKGYSMGPDELALLQVLLQSGYTEEQAMQMLSSGALTAPGVAPPAVQQAMQPYATPKQAQQRYDASPPDLMGNMSNYPTSSLPGYTGNPLRVFDPSIPVDPGSMGMDPYGDVQPTTMDNYTGWDASIAGYPDPHEDMGAYYDRVPKQSRMLAAPSFAAREKPPAYWGAGAMGMPMGMGVPVGGVNPNAYEEKERSYGGDARDAQAYGRDFSGDLGAIIRELVNAGRSAAAAQRPSAQRNPSRPSSPGRSASAPGQMKKAAGVQSARSFTPAATRATTTPTKARTVTAPVTKPAAPKPPTPKGSVVATRGKAIANTITKPKSRF